MTDEEAVNKALDAMEKAADARDLAEKAEKELLEAIKGLGGNANSAEARSEWIKMRKRIRAALKALDTEVDGSDA